MALRIVVGVVGTIAVAATPLTWLVTDSGTAQAVGAVAQCVLGAAALLWAVFTHPAPPPGAVDHVVDGGRAESTGGGTAISGIRRPGGGTGGRATVERGGDAFADGQGGTAVSGIDYT